MDNLIIVLLNTCAFTGSTTWELLGKLADSFILYSLQRIVHFIRNMIYFSDIQISIGHVTAIFLPTHPAPIEWARACLLLSCVPQSQTLQPRYAVCIFPCVAVALVGWLKYEAFACTESGGACTRFVLLLLPSIVGHGMHLETFPVQPDSPEENVEQTVQVKSGRKPLLVNKVNIVPGGINNTQKLLNLGLLAVQRRYWQSYSSEKGKFLSWRDALYF